MPLYVATRKGLFRWTPKSRFELIGFRGDPVSAVLPDPRDGTLYAALNLGHFGSKLQRSADGGATWTEIAVPAYPKSDDPKAPGLEQIWCLEPGGADQPGVLWAGTIPGGLFRSNDGGDSWSLVESLWNRPEREKWFGGGYDSPEIHSICVHPGDSDHVTLGVSCGGAWITRDGGDSWELKADGMEADYMPPERKHDPAIQDPHRIARCAAHPEVLWCQHHNGIFRSADGGDSWTRITTARPADFGFGVAAHPVDPDTAWFVPAVKDACRVPVDGRVVVTRTRDGGKTFDVLTEGLPQEDAYDLVYRHAFDIDGSGEKLAMGSTTGSLWLSTNGGEAWKLLNPHLPPIYQIRFAGE